MISAAALRTSDDPADWAAFLGVRSVKCLRIVHGQIGERVQPQALNDVVHNIAKSPSSISPQALSPSSPDEHATGKSDMEWPTDARKPADHRREVRSGLHLALVTKIPTYKNPAKNVAAATGASEATVRSLRQENIPEAMITLVMLGRTFPDFRTEVARLMGMERDLSPEFQREFAQLLRRVL